MRMLFECYVYRERKVYNALHLIKKTLTIDLLDFGLLSGLANGNFHVQASLAPWYSKGNRINHHWDPLRCQGRIDNQECC